MVMAPFLYLVLGCTLHFSGSVQTLTASLNLQDVAYMEQNISLTCAALEYGPNLANFEWYKEGVDGSDRLIYRFDVVSEIGYPHPEYENRTDSELGSDGNNVTLTIMNAMMEIDDGTYHCTVQEIPGAPIPSDKLNVSVYAIATISSVTTDSTDCAVNITCASTPGRPIPTIELEYNGTATEYPPDENCIVGDYYCAVNRTLQIDIAAEYQAVKCILIAGYPSSYIETWTEGIPGNNNCTGDAAIQTGTVDDEWWIGLLSVCSILAVWIVIIVVGVCILHERVTRLTFWLFIIISNTILVIIGLCVVVPMYNERDNLWLCPLITSLLLIVLDVCIGVCIYMNRPRRQDESIQIRDGQTLRLNYHHSMFGLSDLSLLKDDTELAGCDISDETWQSSSPLATCTETSKGHEWTIKVASSGDAGVYTCIAYLRRCRVSIASKPTEVTVKFNEAN